MLRPSKLIPFAVLGGLILTITAGVVPAQQPIPLLPPPGQPAAQQPDPNGQLPGVPEGAEVMTRGPVHEAYASTAEQTVATPAVPKQPPEPIEELPPDQKPEGDNVQWMPGYWHWDDDAEQFMWISGFWRAVPPGRVWVPGSWREVRGGWQWVQGFWQEPDPQQPQQPEIQYLPEPPATLEAGPSVVAPTQTSFYIPGSWVWRGRYVWRPGFFIEHRPGWVWVPAHFRWTPVGYVFVDGYWDFVPATRGVLFAPIVFARPVYLQPAFVYTPAYVVSEPAMFGALFVRRGWGNYYFGDYFAPRYATGGFNVWCGVVGPRGGFTIGFGVGRTWGYDPFYSYFSIAHRNDRAWAVGVGNLYGGRFNGTIAAPPRTLVQQNTVINKITNVNVTNVTNNVTVVNRNVRVNNHDVTEVAMVAPVKVAKDLQPEAKVQAINAQVRKEQAAQAKEIREVAVQRRKLETAALEKGPVGKNAAPKTLKLDVPRTVAARAQVKDEKFTPPANPNRDVKAATKVDPKVDHKVEPNPVFSPRAKTEPKGKIEPKGEPKVEPKGKGDPKGEPKGKFDPKGDPKGKFDPKDPKGKGDPKPPVLPDPRNKGEPKGKFDPKDPKGDPKGKFDPKGDPKDLKGEPKKKDKDDKDKKDPPPPTANAIPSGRPMIGNRPAVAQPAKLPATPPRQPVALPRPPANQPPAARPRVNPPPKQVVQPKLPATQPRVTTPKQPPAARPKAPANKQPEPKDKKGRS